MENIGTLPSGVKELFRANGVDPTGFLFAVTGDMDPEGNFASSWLAFDAKGLYVAFGAEELIPVSKDKKSEEESKEYPAKGAKALTTRWRLDGIVTYPIDEFEKIDVERYVSTGALIGKKDGNDHPIIRFTLGLNAFFDDFAKAFNAFKKGEDLEELKKTFHESPVCPKCGMRYPDPRRPICPKCMDKRSTIKRLFSFFGGYKKQVAIIIATILLSTLIGVFTPQISTNYLYDNVLNADNMTPTATLIVSLGWVVLAIFGVRLFNLLFRMAYTYVLAGILPWVVYDIKVKIFRAMQRLGVGFYTAKQTGSLMERVTRDANNIYWFFVDGLPYVFTNGLTIVGIIIIMFVMSWKLSIIAIVSLPVVYLIFRVLDNLWRRLHHRRWVYNARMSNMVSDNINGARVIKAFSREKEESARFAVASNKFMGAEIEMGNTECTAYPLLFLFIFTITTSILGIGSIFVARGEMTLGELLTFVIYMDMLHGPMDFLSWVSNWWARCVDAAQRVFEIIDTEPDVTEKPDAKEIENFRGSVEIKELEFEYEPARPIIKKLDLKVEAGHMLGIVGKTGAGKTTIANLIARLYDAKAGTITIDGVDVRDMKLSQLRENIGLVSQDIYLFIGTIADNIRYAKPDASIEEVVAAAKAASAHEFIMRLPDGYETRVGAGGQDLSGGERQRVSIARTIIQNPKILILDEATAAMDTETERNIQESLTKLQKGRTTLAIAHRLSTLRDADELAVIDDGKVVEYGTYDELMKKKGEYYKLYQIQAEALKYVGIGD
ncbi:MAG: ATP-binding cassette domain-containing protein [Clostridia bacterium]|nr:ATP-binding cassette domain-containing protein [Clostridia bacterium]